VFEKNGYWGGHTDTHTLMIEGQPTRIDSGFIVFNEHNYPLFSDMLKQLQVECQASNMSFSVNNMMSKLQYNPSQKWSLFSKPSNFLRRDFRVMLKDLLRFYQAGRLMDVSSIDASLSLADYLDQNNYSQAFRLEHLYPMCGALWSTPIEAIGDIPLRFVIGFFQHHRMLQLNDRPQWLTVKGGSSQYIKAIQTQHPKIYWHMAAVTQVERFDTHVKVHSTRQVQAFDWVIFACHADDTLSLLAQPTAQEQHVLGNITYQDNKMVVHTDSSIMPKRRSLWASWHVHVNADASGKASYSFSYWMNRLQNLSCNSQILATLNPNVTIDPNKILVTRDYRHPHFDEATLLAQQQWDSINGQHRSSFCGAYWGWGFHEDGARSAARVVDAIAQQQAEAISA
jgi:predicted NAD/FAD-binding protein